MKVDTPPRARRLLALALLLAASASPGIHAQITTQGADPYAPEAIAIRGTFSIATSEDIYERRIASGA